MGDQVLLIFAPHYTPRLFDGPSEVTSRDGPGPPGQSHLNLFTAGIGNYKHCPYSVEVQALAISANPSANPYMRGFPPQRRGPGQQGPDETQWAGRLVFKAAAFQVAGEGGGGRQTVTGAGDADDKSLRVGTGLAGGLGAGPLQAKLTGHAWRWSSANGRVSSHLRARTRGHMASMSELLLMPPGGLLLQILNLVRWHTFGCSEAGNSRKFNFRAISGHFGTWGPGGRLEVWTGTESRQGLW